MKKEVLIAIIVGFSLGLVITFGIYRAQKSIKERANRNNTTQETQTEELPEILLSITQPQDGDIFDQDSITIGGITQKESLVTAISSEDHQATQADELGNFSIEFELDTGANDITITSFNQDGTKQEKEMTVVYTTYDFEEASEEEAEE
ncbi:hypothetical protein ACFL1M_00325 [Patescibacteria group bacterium]